MKANELRIGNYYDDFGIVRQVSPAIIEDVWIAERSWCKPIPLTEEWLVKFGFDIDGDDLILDTGLFLLVKYNDDELVHLKSNHLETIISIKYVHTLQNLYFALTGDELTIKE